MEEPIYRLRHEYRTPRGYVVFVGESNIVSYGGIDDVYHYGCRVLEKVQTNEEAQAAAVKWQAIIDEKTN